jgi:bifunctional DNA-binding transcriptional regulator/antitoxin component of YhaV-PrlF toxin-antitoxin module
MQIDIASVTVKGQFTIPRKFCDVLKLTAGSKMFIVCDGEHLLLKPLTPPDFKAFAKVVRESKELAEKARKGAMK